jgi:hypothetical protein
LIPVGKDLSPFKGAQLMSSRHSRYYCVLSLTELLYYTGYKCYL